MRSRFRHEIAQSLARSRTGLAGETAPPDPEANQVTADVDERNADVGQRFKEQNQLPGAEAAPRRIIQELQNGSADYSSMSLYLAAAYSTRAVETHANAIRRVAIMTLRPI
jgi:hypothetical protein